MRFLQEKSYLKAKGRITVVALWLSVLSVPAAFGALQIGECSMSTNGLVSVPITADDLTSVAGADIKLQFDPTACRDAQR